MNGMQKTAYDRIAELLAAIEGGKYGRDDDLDVEGLANDLRLPSSETRGIKGL